MGISALVDLVHCVPRSAHQLKFHSAFERATARVIYRDDWGTQRPAIMEKNGWETCSSEVLIRYVVNVLSTHTRPNLHSVRVPHTTAPLGVLAKHSGKHCPCVCMGFLSARSVWFESLVFIQHRHLRCMPCADPQVRSRCVEHPVPFVTFCVCRSPCLLRRCSAHVDATELLCSRVAVVFSPARRASRKLLERMVE